MSKTLNPDYISALTDMVNKSPYASSLGITITHISWGRAQGEVTIGRQHHNAFGGIHGGMYASMVDHLSFFCLFTMLPEDMGATSLDLHTDYLRSCTEGTLFVDAQVVKKGGQISLVEVDITDERGNLMAHGTSKMLSSATLQSATEIIKTMNPETVLPPKFL